MNSPSLTISLVVPARNEAAVLPRLLASVDAARLRYRADAGSVEVIVADNGSTDSTAALAREHGCRVVSVAPRVISAVRNGGAAAARGEVLAFVDADMQLHPDTFVAIAAALDDPAIIGGASGIRPERWSPGIAVVYCLTSAGGAVTGFDAGLAYSRRGAFQDIGGYDDRRSSLEDVDFLWRLKRYGARRGRRLARLKASPAIYSTRKFDELGDWHWLGLGARMVYSRAWRRDVRTAEVQAYWYDNRDGRS
jgi:glycosyltransferase involved in cell wall biosynthesis